MMHGQQNVKSSRCVSRTIVNSQPRPVTFLSLYASTEQCFLRFVDLWKNLAAEFMKEACCLEYTVLQVFRTRTCYSRKF